MGKLRSLSAWFTGAAGLALAACGARKPVPEIGEGLPLTPTEGYAAFDARVKARFPVGSEVAPMVATLEDQGFKLSAPEGAKFKILNYRDGGFPVYTHWSVSWYEDQGKITEIWGVFGHTGP